MAEPDSKLVRVDWGPTERAPVSSANVFLSQFANDLFILTMGMVVPPPIIEDDPEERRRKASEITDVPAVVVARAALTVGSMRQLVGILQDNLRKYEEAYGDTTNG